MNVIAPELDSLAPQNAAAFAAWASIYDTQANPLLVLEERFLTQLLPDVNGKDILDVGCGTGRWLEHFARHGIPRSLCGIDSSYEMLSVARHKSIPDVSLLQTQLPCVPLTSASVDLAIASFVLSYIPEIDACARELANVLRDGAELFITDVHPTTAITLGWQRKFSSPQGSFHLHSDSRSIESTIHLFAQNGFYLVASYQPSFGEPEYSIFLSQGKEASYQKADGRPAIYILHFKRGPIPNAEPDLLLNNAQCVLGGREVITADLEVQNGTLTTICSVGTRGIATHRVDLSGYTLFPGLINAHDHLEFALFPRLGQPPYHNAAEWALDIQHCFRDTININRSVPKAVRLWWGALRNLLCGATTVCHHNPFHPVFSERDFPVRIVTDFGWAHSLAFAKDIVNTHKHTDSSYPFIIHACEGTDATARSEFTQLRDLSLIDDRAVLVHGLAMTSAEINILNSCGGSLIICPSSNQFLFAETPTLELLNSVRKLAIGSDSPLTAVGDLLDEVDFCCQQLHLPAERLFECVTQAPARILRLKHGAGHIAPGCLADIFAVRTSTLAPAEHLALLSWRDVELVIVNGLVRLASAEMFQRLPPEITKHLSCLLVDGVPRWLDAPLGTLFKFTVEALGIANIFLSGRTLSLMEA